MSSEAAGAQPIAEHVAGAPYPPAAVGWYATVMLAFLYWLSVLDRFVISLLVDPIKASLGISDVQFGMLHGLAFVVSFTVFGLVFGALADRMSRRWIIYVGVTVWSLATAACGFAQSFLHMLLARVGVGVGEASLNPSATSMIADLFPRTRLTTAMAVYGIGATVGSGTALIIGGAIVDLVSESGPLSLPLVGDIHPWQAVFLLVGLPGALIALSIFSVPEPLRRDHRGAPMRGDLRGSYTGLARFVRARARFFGWHYTGFTFASAIVTGGAAWYPAHMSRAFGWSAGEVGMSLGPALLAAGVIGKLLCGTLVDAMYRRGYRDAQMRWYGYALLVATPVGMVATLSEDPWVFIVAIGVFMTLIGALQACALTALNLVTPNPLRGTGVALFTTVAGLAGGGAGPVLIAAFSEHVFGGKAALGPGLAATIAICCPLGAACLLRGLAAMREAMAEGEVRAD